MGLLQRLLGYPTTPTVTPFIFWREGSFPTRAVGEGDCQVALSEVCGGPGRPGYEHLCEAHLLPDADNPQDANAVKVVVQGRLVGYLSRADAVRFREQMARTGRRGGARCAAKINGGWRTNQRGQATFGIRLGVPTRGCFEFGEPPGAPSPQHSTRLTARPPSEVSL
jgi:hypothetical protein